MVVSVDSKGGGFQFRSPICIHKGFRLFGRTKVLFGHHQARPEGVNGQCVAMKITKQRVDIHTVCTLLMTSSALRPSVTTGTVKTGAGWALTLRGNANKIRGSGGDEGS